MSARVALALALGLTALTAQAETDPLPLWNDGPAKQEIVDYVQRVSTSGLPDYVPPSQRIAVFDHDGTLVAERPAPLAAMFAAARLKELVPKHPEWRRRWPFQAALEKDPAALWALSPEERLRLMAAAGDGLTVERFEELVRAWLLTTKSPDRPQRMAELVYRPMVQLIDYLQENGFTVFILTDGDPAFVRSYSEAVFNVPRANVIGSPVVTRYEGAKGELVRTKTLVTPVKGGPGKVELVERGIGLRPLLSFGNAEDDLPLLRYTTSGTRASLALLLQHDDPAREWAYAGAPAKAAKESGATVVSMKRDFRAVFPAAE